MNQRIVHILALSLSTGVACAQAPPEIQSYRDEPEGDYSGVSYAQMDGNNVRATLYNTSQIGNWPSSGIEWPKGSGHLYLGDASMLFGAKIHLPDGTIITPIEGHYRGWYDFDPARGSQYGWDFEPVPGYKNPASTTPAISDNPASWPSSWNNTWHGMDGTDSLRAQLEMFFVIDDSKDAEYSPPPYNFFPISADSSRKGLGLRVEARVLQWNSDTLARDMVVMVYDIINLSDCDYDTVAFGMLLFPGVGSFQTSLPAQTVFVSPSENMLVAYATDGLGYPDNWNTGLIGLVFLQAPGGSPQDTGSVKVAAFATHIRSDHGIAGFDLRNDSTLWNKMSSGFSDTTYNNGPLAVVIATRIFSLPKWSRQRCSLALVFAQDRNSLSAKAALARRIAAAGYRLDTTATGVSAKPSAPKPVRLSLKQNFPNPFNPTTTIQFTLVNRQLTILRVFDVLGHEVALLVNELKGPGTFSVQFDGSSLASGLYICRLETGRYAESRKMLLIK
jgi:hypothetical protein